MNREVQEWADQHFLVVLLQLDIHKADILAIIIKITLHQVPEEQADFLVVTEDLTEDLEL
jgi:hypothetical protein